MPNYASQNPIMRPELDMFYVLDSSGSMNYPNSEPITVLNRAMQSTLQAVRLENENNRDADVKVAVLDFNSNCRWLNPAGPERLDSFMYEDLTAAGGTHMGAALRELNSKLSRRGFINAMGGNLMPVIIFMTDGFPTDDYESELEKIKQNKWFSHAVRIGFAIGKNPDQEMIAKLTGSSETVIRTRDLGVFAQLLRWVSMTSSMLSSQVKSSTGETGTTRNIGADAVREAKRQAGYDPDDLKPDFEYEEDPIKGGSWGPDAFFVETDEFGNGDVF